MCVTGLVGYDCVRLSVKHTGSSWCCGLDTWEKRGNRVNGHIYSREASKQHACLMFGDICVCVTLFHMLSGMFAHCIVQ